MNSTPTNMADTIGLQPAADSLLSVQSMFGPRAELVNRTITTEQEKYNTQSGITDNVVYQSCLIVLFVLFFATTYMYREWLGELVKVVSRTGYLQRLYKERSNLFKHYMRNTTIVGGLLAALLVVRTVESFFSDYFDYQHYGMMTLASIMIVASIFIYRMVVTRLMAFVSTDVPFFKVHNYISSIYWVVGVNLVAPLFLFGCNFYGGQGDVALKIIGFLCSLVLIIYLYHSYLFFLKLKVSNLQWILYLCAVDIFPISLVAALWKM